MVTSVYIVSLGGLQFGEEEPSRESSDLNVTEVEFSFNSYKVSEVEDSVTVEISVSNIEGANAATLVYEIDGEQTKIQNVPEGSTFTIQAEYESTVRLGYISKEEAIFVEEFEAI